jgi:hypothetical protein
MSACLLLDPFQLYIGMSVVFGLSIYTAPVNSCTAGNENMLFGVFFFGGGGVNKIVSLWVIAEKMKILSYFHVGNNPYLQDVS